CHTGLSVRHVGERFQHANGTISKYFHEILFAVSSPSFYNQYVQLPSENDLPPEYLQTGKLQFLSGALGAVDGTHIACSPPASEQDLARNWK
ncbi:hypothetical protein K435DRAFT_581584, partial [Dendrothele bispora CBS 962.96]